MSALDRPVAFYAPVKLPDHSIASGDREIARLLIAALRRAGCTVEIASRWISYSKKSDPAELAERRGHAATEIARIRADWLTRAPAERPGLVLTYHPYCKAPDLIGPPLAAAFGIPYATVEACRTNQGVNDEWRPWREIVTAGVRQAAINFCFTDTDRRYLGTILADDASIRDLRPFVDAAAIAGAKPAALPAGLQPDAPVMLAVGMLRPGAKMESHRMLADAFCLVDEPDWNLVIVGDGPGRAEVEALYGGLAQGCVRIAGALDHEEVIALMRTADLFVWPGNREAIGMVYLEAQAAGIPVVAQATAGVPEAVADGVTGLLTPQGDASAMAASIRTLLLAPDRRKQMGNAARDRIAQTRDIAQAAEILKATLVRL